MASSKAGGGSASKLRKRSGSSSSARPQPQAQLERVIGCSAFGPAAVAQHEPKGLYAFPAGCVVVLYSHKDSTQNKYLFSPSNKCISCVAISANGKYVVAGETGPQPCVVVWDIGTGEMIASLQEHSSGIVWVGFSPSSQYVLSLGNAKDRSLRLWNWKDKVVVASKPLAGGDVYSADFAADETYFVTVGDKHVKVWMIDAAGAQQNAYSDPTSKQDIEPVSVKMGTYQDHQFVSVACGRAANSAFIYVLTNKGVLCAVGSTVKPSKSNIARSKRGPGKSFDLQRWVDLRLGSGFSMSVNEKWLAIGGADGRVRVFRADSLAHVGTLPKPCPIGPVASLLGPGLNKKELRESVEAVKAASLQYPDCTAVLLSDSDTIFSLYSDRSIIIWDVKDPKMAAPVRTFQNHSGCIWDLVVLPSSVREQGDATSNKCADRAFVTCSDDCTVRFWKGEGSTDKGGPTVESAVRRPPSVASPKGVANLASLSGDSAHIVFNGTDFTHMKHPFSPAPSSLSPSSAIPEEGATDNGASDARAVSATAAAPASGDAEALEEGGFRVGQLQDGHSESGSKSPASASAMGLTSPSAAMLARRDKAPKAGVRRLCVVPSKTKPLLAIGDRNGNIRILDMNTLQDVSSVAAHDAEVSALASCETADHRFVGSGSRDRLVHLFDLPYSGESVGESVSVASYPDHKGAITALGFAKNPDGLTMVTAGADETVVFRQLRADGTLAKLKSAEVKKGAVYDMCVHPSNKFVVTGGADKKLHIWDLNAKKTRSYKAADKGAGEVVRVSLDPGGLFVLSTHADRFTRVFDWFSGTCLLKLGGHSEMVTAARFSHDGERLYTASVDGCIMVWRLPPTLTKAIKDRMVEMREGPVTPSATSTSSPALAKASSTVTVTAAAVPLASPDIKDGVDNKAASKHEDGMAGASSAPTLPISQNDIEDKTSTPLTAPSAGLSAVNTSSNPSPQTAQSSPGLATTNQPPSQSSPHQLDPQQPQSQVSDVQVRFAANTETLPAWARTQQLQQKNMSTNTASAASSSSQVELSKPATAAASSKWAQRGAARPFANLFLEPHSEQEVMMDADLEEHKVPGSQTAQRPEADTESADVPSARPGLLGVNEQPTEPPGQPLGTGIGAPAQTQPLIPPNLFHQVAAVLAPEIDHLASDLEEGDSVLQDLSDDEAQQNPTARTKAPFPFVTPVNHDDLLLLSADNDLYDDADEDDDSEAGAPAASPRLDDDTAKAFIRRHYSEMRSEPLAQDGAADGKDANPLRQSVSSSFLSKAALMEPPSVRSEPPSISFSAADRPLAGPSHHVSSSTPGGFLMTTQSESSLVTAPHRPASSVIGSTLHERQTNTQREVDHVRQQMHTLGIYSPRKAHDTTDEPASAAVGRPEVPPIVVPRLTLPSSLLDTSRSALSHAPEAHVSILNELRQSFARAIQMYNELREDQVRLTQRSSATTLHHDDHDDRSSALGQQVGGVHQISDLYEQQLSDMQQTMQMLLPQTTQRPGTGLRPQATSEAFSVHLAPSAANTSRSQTVTGASVASTPTAASGGTAPVHLAVDAGLSTMSLFTPVDVAQSLERYSDELVKLVSRKLTRSLRAKGLDIDDDADDAGPAANQQ